MDDQQDQQRFTITFDNGSTADANRWASELKAALVDATEDVEVEQQPENPDSQDLGTMLQLAAIGTPAVVAVAKALLNWLEKRRGSRIKIKTPHGEIDAANLTPQDVMKLAEMLLALQSAQE